MLTLKLDDIPDEGLDLKWKEETAALSGYLETLSDIDFQFEHPLQSEAKIRRMGKSVWIRGKVQTVLQLRCVRCLKEFSYPLASVFELTLRSLKETGLTEEVELSEKDLESNFFEGEEIALSEVACEQVFLEIPMQPLCQEGCKGLCPGCGKDLNVSSCECKKKELESEFSVLRKLKLK
jgi:uncharacterized protein